MRRVLGTLASALALAGCSMTPHYQRPEPPVPASWPVGDAYLRQSEAALPTVTYRDIFKDPRLQSLIAQALDNNRDLRAAVANIEVARAQYRIQRADLFPAVDATAGAGVSNAVRATGPSAGKRTTVGNYSAGIGVNAFELDLFGRVRSLTTAAQDRYFATAAGARATRLTLVGDLATAWLDYAADASLLKIAQDTAANAQRSVDLTRARLNGGIAPRTDLRQAEQVLETAQSDLAASQTALAQDVNAIQLLVGAPVDPALLPASIDSVEASIGELPAGMDTGILLRRPDVVQSEYTLRAANANIGAARAALFPRISLTALASLASTALGSLFKTDALSLDASGNASYSIFNAGAGRANVAQARAQFQVDLANYEKTVQTAFREVADALARRGTIDAQERADVSQVASAADNYALSEARYRGGIDTFLNSLIAQRTLYSAQRRLVQTRLTRASNVATLYRVLGGDALLDAPDHGGPVPLSPGDASEPPAKH